MQIVGAGEAWMKDIRGQVASTLVIPVMDQIQIGTVHSVFNNSFNLIFAERLIHIGASENGLSPFGIGINSIDAKRLCAVLKQNMKAAWNQETEQLQLETGHVISLAEVELQDLALAANEEPDLHQLSVFAKQAVGHLMKHGHLAGLLSTLEEQAAVLGYLVDDVKDATFPLLEPLHQLEQLAKGDPDIIPQKVYDYWIGRGPGLTPSGDDMLTGLLASFELQGRLSLELRASLKTYLETQGLKRTTPVACEYLLYALRGFFHHSIQGLCKAFSGNSAEYFQQALLEMEQIGHTSGIDTIIGMLLGLKAGRNLK